MMKNLNRKIALGASLAGIFMLTGCSGNEDNNHGLEYERLQVNFAGTIAFSELTEGTQVGLFGTCTRGEQEGFTLATNSLYRVSYGDKAYLDNGGDPVISEKTDHNFKFGAYFPWRGDVTSSSAIPVEIPAVQRYADGVDSYMTYVASTIVTTVVPTVSMEFRSVGARIDLNLADDIVDEDGNSRIRSIRIKAPDGERLESPLVVNGLYDLDKGEFLPDEATASQDVMVDFGAEGITLATANTVVGIAVAPFTVPQSGLVAEITDMSGKTLTTPILDGTDAGKAIAAGETKSCYVGRVSDGIIPVSFPVEWPVGYENGAYIVSSLTQPLWLTDGIWTCPSQPQANISWHKVSDPSEQYSQKLEFVNSGKDIGSPGIKGVWTGDYFEITLPVKRFASGTTVNISFPMYTRQGPVFWDIEYLDGDVWKCNKSMVTAYDKAYSRECTFSLVRGATLVRHTMVFEKEIKSGELKIRIKCADGTVQASADKTCTVREIPFTDSNGYGAPFYFYDKTKEMTSLVVDVL